MPTGRYIQYNSVCPTNNLLVTVCNILNSVLCIHRTSYVGSVICYGRTFFGKFAIGQAHFWRYSFRRSYSSSLSFSSTRTPLKTNLSHSRQPRPCPVRVSFLSCRPCIVTWTTDLTTDQTDSRILRAHRLTPCTISWLR